MVAQQKMKDNLSDSSSDNQKTAIATAKSKLSMLKRSSTKQPKQKAPAVSSSDPFRFHENGVDFKGKLIGEREVQEARGDQMCSDAMKLVKSAVKAAGAHKQRIVLNVSINGLKIRDEKSSIIIHNFPVAKISFIARDTTDARAFGFVFGTTDGKYKFYGIKTAQTADHAVLAIRDMFQVVFEMKKKQIEEVKQKKEEQENNENAMKEDGIRVENGLRMADLIDLESELEHIAIGFNQLQNIPSMPEDSWPTTSNDPFSMSSLNSTQNTSSTTSNGFFNDPFASFNVSSPQQQHQHHQASLFGNQSAPQASNIWPSTPQVQTPQPMAFSESNPFLQAANGNNGVSMPNPASFKQQNFPLFNPPINHVATVQPQLPSDPFDTQGLRKAITSIPQLSSISLPPPTQPPPLPPSYIAPLQPSNGIMNNSNNFADFSVLNPSQPKIEEKKINIDDLFNELIDTNVLMQKVPEQKKNPFEHIINPPKPSIVALASQNNMCSSSHNGHHQVQTQQQFVLPTARSDPFNDDFFN
jgi:ABC-type antimicrobial peptide transport system permease subunit